jgi:hypothetical protein
VCVCVNVCTNVHVCVLVCVGLYSVAIIHDMEGRKVARVTW